MLEERNIAQKCLVGVLIFVIPYTLLLIFGFSLGNSDGLERANKLGLILSSIMSFMGFVLLFFPYIKTKEKQEEKNWFEIFLKRWRNFWGYGLFVWIIFVWIFETFFNNTYKQIFGDFWSSKKGILEISDTFGLFVLVFLFSFLVCLFLAITACFREKPFIRPSLYVLISLQFLLLLFVANLFLLVMGGAG